MLPLADLAEKKKKWQKRRVFEMTRGMIKSHCSQFGEIKITLCTRQQKRHWCIEQSYGLCGRGRGWEVLGEWHWNTCNIMYETSCQSRFDARYWMLGAGALDAWGWCTGTTQRDGMGREEGGGFRMGNTCIPVADSFWYLAKLKQLCKV